MDMVQRVAIGGASVERRELVLPARSKPVGTSHSRVDGTDGGGQTWYAVGCMSENGEKVATENRQTVVEWVQGALMALRDESRAVEMRAYLKTEQPMLGISEPARRPVFKEMTLRYPPRNGSEYRANVCALWEAGRRPGGYREMQYAALWYAEHFDEHHDAAQFPLWRRLVVEGGWWDLVDRVATQLVSPIVKKHRAKSMVVMKRWIDDEDLWVRRAAILCQVGHKEATDEAVLYDFCLRRAEEEDFFIRKAIGWALREYAKVKPESVKAFLESNQGRLSPLSVREGGKHLNLKPVVRSSSGSRVRKAAGK